MNKVGREVAEKEIIGWLDCKRVSDKKREDQKENINSLISAVCEGSLTVKDDNTLVHELLFPIGSEAKIAKLEYKPRIHMGVIHKHLEGIKPSDADGRICAYIAALTSNPKDVVRLLDTEDYSIAQSIAIFFL